MSNGHVCCLLAVCCPPEAVEERARALCEEFTRANPWSTKTPGVRMEDWATWVIKTFDLVPKGVGEAIVKGYATEFAKKHAGKPTPEL